jgi:hypothetical protein
MPTIDPTSELRVRPEELGERQINEMTTAKWILDAGFDIESRPAAERGPTASGTRQGRVYRTDRGLLRSVLGPWSPVPNARHLGHPFQWKNTLPRHLGPAAKIRILRFKNLAPFRDDRGLQKLRLRYSPGLAPTTRLNALLNAASDS